MARIDQSGLRGKIRDRRIAPELEALLARAADAAGIDTVRVTSGGQPGTTGRSTGSTRHNGGRAADLELLVNGRRLAFSDEDGGDQVESFVTAAAACGAIGIGAGIAYMGPTTLHIGFGLTPADTQKLVWGAKGKSANAPQWLREAAEKGWADPAGALAALARLKAETSGEPDEHDIPQDEGRDHDGPSGYGRPVPVSLPLRQGLRLPDLAEIFPNAEPAVLASLRGAGAGALARQGILANERRFAWFLAQVAHESGGLRTLKENLNYRAERIVEVFAKYIPTLAAAQAFAGNPVALANRVYGGRMGNGSESSGDGYRFRGRGLIQLTGRNNYRAVGRITGLPLESDPDLASEPGNVWAVAAGYWTMRGLNAFCDAGDFRGLTQAINGRLRGLEDREARLRAVERLLDRTGFVPFRGEEPPDDRQRERDMDDDAAGGGAGDLTLGSRVPSVGALQKRLNELGYFVGAEDSIFGKYTRQGLLAFQAEQGLPTTGRLDAATQAMLDLATERTVEGARPGTDEEKLINRSSIVYDSSWNRLLGKIAAGLGAFGLVNSSVVNAVAPSVPPDALARAKQIADAVARFRPDDPATAQPLLDLAQKVVEQKAPQAAGVTQNVFEMLSRNAGGGNISGIADVLGTLAGTLLPGAGGSLATLGIGVASWLISNRVISRRIADHRSGRHLGR